MKDIKRRRGALGGLLAACCVAVGVLMGAAPGSAQAEEKKLVFDLARAACAADGCGVIRPARWIPSREPRQGLGIVFGIGGVVELERASSNRTRPDPGMRRRVL